MQREPRSLGSGLNLGAPCSSIAPTAGMSGCAFDARGATTTCAAHEGWGARRDSNDTADDAADSPGAPSAPLLGTAAASAKATPARVALNRRYALAGAVLLLIAVLGFASAIGARLSTGVWYRDPLPAVRTKPIPTERLGPLVALHALTGSAWLVLVALQVRARARGGGRTRAGAGLGAPAGTLCARVLAAGAGLAAACARSALGLQAEPLSRWLCRCRAPAAAAQVSSIAIAGAGSLPSIDPASRPASANATDPPALRLHRALGKRSFLFANSFALSALVLVVAGAWRGGKDAEGGYNTWFVR